MAIRDHKDSYNTYFIHADDAARLSTGIPLAMFGGGCFGAFCVLDNAIMMRSYRGIMSTMGKEALIIGGGAAGITVAFQLTASISRRIRGYRSSFSDGAYGASVSCLAVSTQFRGPDRIFCATLGICLLASGLYAEYKAKDQ